MKRTYYIVRHKDGEQKPFWEAHKRGVLSTLGIYSVLNYVNGTTSYVSAFDCTEKLYIAKPKRISNVVGVLQL
jgi:hypothetical protein